MIFRALPSRHREPEWMDAADVDAEQLRQSLAFIRRVNQFLGYTRATIRHLKRFTKNWPRGKQLSILDVATGSGDVPAAILKWADRRGFDVRIVAIDLHSLTLRTAASQCGDSRIKFIQADATNLPFTDGGFNFVLSSMFLHHVDHDIAIRVLREMDRVAERGVILADLLRRRRALFWINVFTIFANPMVKHDARVSVTGAFSSVEAKALRNEAGLDYLKYSGHFAHRFVLAGEKIFKSP